jgi:hypothetical protein
MFLIGIIAVFSLAAGCVWQETRVERDYGTSYQLQKYNQTLNPEAEKNLTPVTGMDGRAAQGAVQQYEKGFEKTAPTTMSYQINVGSMGGK